MRMRTVCWVLVLALVFLLLAGCQDNGESFNVIGTVENAGVAQAGATVTLLQNGAVVAGPQATPASGNFTFTGVAPGTYVLWVFNGGVNTFFGPFTIPHGLITIEAPTNATLPPGVTVPTNGTATAVATAQLANGTPITTQSLQLQADSFTNNTVANPAVVTGIIESTYTVFVTDTATGNLAIFPKITLPANRVTVFRAVVTPPPPPATITGTLTQNGTAVGNTEVAISESTTFPAAVTTTTNGAGQFTFTGLRPGTYYLRTGPTDSLVTIYGPINVTRTPPAAITFERAPGMEVIVPTTTATAVANAIENGVLTTNVLRLTVGTVSTASTPPVVLPDLTAGNHAVTILDTSTSRRTVFASVAFPAGTVVVFRAVLE